MTTEQSTQPKPSKASEAAKKNQAALDLLSGAIFSEKYEELGAGDQKYIQDILAGPRVQEVFVRQFSLKSPWYWTDKVIQGVITAGCIFGGAFLVGLATKSKKTGEIAVNANVTRDPMAANTFTATERPSRRERPAVQAV